MERTVITSYSIHYTKLYDTSSKEIGSHIERAIGRLRVEYRTAILLCHVEGRPYEEVARIMDVPLGTVKTYIHRARNELVITSYSIHYTKLYEEWDGQPVRMALEEEAWLDREGRRAWVLRRQTEFHLIR